MYIYILTAEAAVRLSCVKIRNLHGVRPAAILSVVADARDRPNVVRRIGTEERPRSSFFFFSAVPTRWE